jgi:hypothetical protein
MGWRKRFTLPSPAAGKYEGVTGQIHNVVSGPGVIDRTFHLIWPDQD